MERVKIMDGETSTWSKLESLLEERKVVPESTLVCHGFKNEDVERFETNIGLKRTRKWIPYKKFRDRVPIETAHLFPGRTIYGGDGDLFYLSDSFLDTHPLAPEVYFELKHELKHSDDVIPKLLKDIIARYDKIRSFGFGEKGYRLSVRKALAASFILTCRGQYMCPVGVKKYSNVMGIGKSKKLEEISKAIGESGVRYSGDELVKNSFKKLKKNFNLSDDCGDIFYKLYEADACMKGNGIILSRPYTGGLAYMAIVLAKEEKTQMEIAEALGISVVALGYNFRNAFGRLEITMEL